MASTLKDRLTTARDSMDGAPSNAELARIAGVRPPSVTAWFTGETKSLKSKTLLAVARALNVRPEWLDTGRGPMRPQDDASGAGSQVAEAVYQLDQAMLTTCISRAIQLFYEVRRAPSAEDIAAVAGHLYATVVRSRDMAKAEKQVQTLLHGLTDASLPLELKELPDA